MRTSIFSAELRHRLLFGGLEAIAAGLACCSLLTPWGLGILAVLLTAILQAAIGEYCALTGKIGAGLFPAGKRLFISAGFLCACRGFDPEAWRPFAASAHLALYLGGIGCALAAMRQTSSALLEISVFLGGVLYLALPLATFYLLVESWGGDYSMRCWWAVYAIALPKATDTGAWAVGRTWGKRSLGLISPHKTLEGIFGGLASGLSAGLILMHVRPGPQLSRWGGALMICLHLTVSAVAQIGDLTESLLKRLSRVRHSGHLPGLGGILDTLDSLLLTFPLLYLARSLC